MMSGHSERIPVKLTNMTISSHGYHPSFPPDYLVPHPVPEERQDKTSPSGSSWKSWGARCVVQLLPSSGRIWKLRFITH